MTTFAGDGEFSIIPRVSDGQLLFLLNNVSKMKETTELGSRIPEVHNGSSLFTDDAGDESNTRRYLIERDLVEAIIALELREQIAKLYFDFEDHKYSKIFKNSAFGYWKVTVLRTLRLCYGVCV